MKLYEPSSNECGLQTLTLHLTLTRTQNPTLTRISSPEKTFEILLAVTLTLAQAEDPFVQTLITGLDNTISANRRASAPTDPNRALAR